MVSAAWYLSYPDAGRAIEWIIQLGFAVVRRDDEGDRVLYSELTRDDVVLMVASDDQEYTIAPLLGRSTGSGIYLAAPDVDDLYASAIAAGGTPVIEPEDTPWGSRRARVLDVGGREWTFGTYRPGESR